MPTDPGFSLSKAIEVKREREKSKSLKRCPQCLVPKKISKTFRWHEGGAIILRGFAQDRLRFILTETELINGIIDILVEQFGEELVLGVVYDTERETAFLYCQMLDDEIRKKAFFLPESVRLRILSNTAMTNFNLLGYGVAQVLSGNKPSDYKHPHSIGYLRNAYNPLLCIADIDAGSSFSHKTTAFKHRLVPISDGIGLYLFVADVIPKKEDEGPAGVGIELSDILTDGFAYPIPGCPVCGAPDSISGFWWDERLGVIIDRDDGERMMLWTRYSIERLLARFEEAMEEAPEIVYEKVRSYWRELLGRHAKFRELAPEAKLGFLETLLPTKGLGLARPSRRGDVLEVEVINPILPVFVAGILAGFYEAVEGKEAAASITGRGAASITITVKPGASP